jgi:hypothetical protein
MPTVGASRKNESVDPRPAEHARFFRSLEMRVVGDHQFQLTEARRVGEDVDFDDLPAPDREAHDRKRLSPWKPRDDSRSSVHERRSCELDKRRESERLLGNGPRTAELPRCARRHGTAVGSDHNLWIENRQKCVEVTAARGSEESIDNFSLTGEIGIGSLGRSSHSAARAARELPCRGWGAPHDGSDLVEGHGEHVVQHEREPLGRTQRFEHQEQRETNRVGQQSFVRGSIPPARLTIGSGTCTPRGSSRRDLRERSMSRHTRATTVVSHPPRFATPVGSERMRRSQASWTASSASLSEPSIR